MSEVKTMSSIQFPNTQQSYQVNDARIPADPGAYQQMVTDGNGNWGVADRLAYKSVEETTLWEGDFTTAELEWDYGPVFRTENSVTVDEYGLFFDKTVFYEMGGKEYLLNGDNSWWGNVHLINPNESDNGEPLGVNMYTTSNFTMLTFFTEKPGNYHVKFYTKNENTHPIPNEYLNVTWASIGSKFDESDMQTVVDETSVTIEQAGTPVENPFSIELSVGAKYIVTWDSIAYECTAYVDEYETISLGNGEIVGLSFGNGEPFFITVYDGAVMMTANEAGTYTISIQAPYEIITPIPEKYLPEGVIPDEVTITFTVTDSDVTADVTHNDLLNAWRNGAKIKAMLTGSPSNDEIAFMGTRGSGGSFFFEYYNSASPSAVITIAYSAYGINRYQSTLTTM